MNKIKLEKGITLIALILTLIVLIVLAVVGINAVSDSGIIARVRETKSIYRVSEIEEKIQLEYMEEKLKSLKVTATELAKRMTILSEDGYPEIIKISPSTNKVYYTLKITGKEYEISTETGEIKEYIDELARVVAKDSSLWVRSNNTITGYNGTGEQLKDVTIPNVLIDDTGNEVKITRINLNGIAFEGTLTIPSSVLIKENSFNACTRLKKVLIGDNVTINAGGSIYDNPKSGTFGFCTSLEEVVMGRNIRMVNNNIKHYFYNWFNGCTALSQVTVGSLSEVSHRAFTSVGAALKGNIVINEGVTTIGENAFNGCTNIESVTIPSSVTSIGTSAFYNCTGIKNSISIVVEKLDKIENSVFFNCSGIRGNIKIKDNAIIGSGAFSTCQNLETLEIGSNISIPANSFNACTRLKKVVIGDNVTINAGGSIYDNPKSGTFGFCTSLEEVTMGKNIRMVNDNIKYYFYNWFNGCTALNKITVMSLSEVSHRAFASVGTALKGSIVINEGVSTIGENAFNGCTNIESVTIPSSVTVIGNSAFYNCTGIQSINVDMTEVEFNSITKGTNWNYSVTDTITYKQ